MLSCVVAIAAVILDERVNLIPVIWSSLEEEVYFYTNFRINL